MLKLFTDQWDKNEVDIQNAVWFAYATPGMALHQSLQPPRAVFWADGGLQVRIKNLLVYIEAFLLQLLFEEVVSNQTKIQLNQAVLNADFFSWLQKPV